MKVFEKIVFIFMSALASSYIHAGEVDNSKITTFTSGSVISSSKVNAAVTEVVSQINDNNDRIIALEAALASVETIPEDYTNILTRITGTYTGVYTARKLNKLAHGEITVTFANGVGTATLSEVAMDYEDRVNPVLITDGGEFSLNLNVSSSGVVSVDEGLLNSASGSVNKSGDFITLVHNFSQTDGESSLLILQKQ